MPPQQFLNPIHGEGNPGDVTAGGDNGWDPTRDPSPGRAAGSVDVGRGDGDMSPSVRKRWETVFKKYDADGSGSIDTKELGKVMTEMGQDLSQAELDTMMEEIDEDGSGEVDFEEFMDAISSHKSLTFDQINAQIEEKIFGKKTREGNAADDGYANPKSCFGLIHPENGRRKIYDMFQLVLLFYTLFAVPVQVAFADEPATWSLVFCIDFAVWLFFTVDLFIQMHTYYLSGRTGQWVSDPTKVRARYFRTWFIVDFVAVFPVDYILRIIDWHSGGEANSLRMLRLARLLRYLRLLKLANMSRAAAVMEVYREKVGFSAMTADFIYKILGLVALCVCFNHLAGCMWIFVGRTYSTRIEPYPDPPVDGWWDDLYGPQIDMGRHPSHWTQYVDACYLVMMTLTSVGYGDITPINEDEKWFCYILMYFTAFMYAYVIGVFADIVANRRSDRNLFDSKMRSVFEFLDHVDAPLELKDKVKVYYSHRYPRKTLFDEDMIYDELPPKFSKQLVLHRFERTVHHVPFFRNATDECIVAICRAFHGFAATPGDFILELGEHNHELIILEYGEASGTDGTIVTKYESGSFFGEMEFLGLQEVSSIAVKAEDFCDLYGLRYGDIAYTLSEYPELQDQMHQYAVAKKQASNRLQGKSGGESATARLAGQPSQTHPSFSDTLSPKRLVGRRPSCS